MDTANENISLKKLSEIEKLSIRSIHVCEDNNLNDLSSILHYYSNNKGFLKLKNCGEKSNTELIQLCEKYQHFSIRPQKTKHENPYEIQVNKLTVRQKKILNNMIESQISELSVRSANVIEKYTDSNFTVKGLQEIIINPDFNYGKFKNVGEKSITELMSFFKSIREQIEIILLFNNEKELTTELFNSYLKRRFYLKTEIIAEIWRNYDETNGLPLFKTINVLITKEVLFNHKEKTIFEKGFNFWNSADIRTLDDTARLLNLTRERARQIRKTLFKKLNSAFSFIKGFEYEALNLYGINNGKDLLIISDETINEINEKEVNSFNKIFINKVLSILFENTYSIIGDEENIVFNKNVRTGHNWSNTYIVKKELAKVFDFMACVDDVSRRLSDRIDEDYSFHFETYLMDFQKEDFNDYSINILQVLEQIILNEFELSIDAFDQIIFRRNTKKQVVEYVYDILEEKNKPLDVYELFETLSEKYPGVTKSAEALRGSCQRDPNLIFFGRSSTYGLRSWEDNESIKGGTMHDIAEEFLLQFEIPKHIDDITYYVSKYREGVTTKNLLYNLKSAENRRFRFFKNNHIGLVDKHYEDDFEPVSKSIIKQNTWEENYLSLKEFTQEYERLPLSSGSGNERKLYNFLNVQKNRIKKSALNSNKAERIIELISSYPQERKRSTRYNKKNEENKSAEGLRRRFTVSSRWWESYNKLAAFIKTNGEYPTATENRALYTFCYNCKKNLENNKLHHSQIQALKNINFSFSSGNQESWDSNFSKLEEFYLSYNQWPRYIKSDINQVQLYRFCLSIFKAFKNGDLDSIQLKKLDNIDFPYEKGTFANVWLDNYEKLKMFRITNPNRWPNARGMKSERHLYQFCYRNKKKFIEGILEDYKIKLLNNINFDFYE